MNGAQKKRQEHSLRSRLRSTRQANTVEQKKSHRAL